MRSRHVLVVCVQGYGHVYPTLGVVEELVRRGHRVTYVTTELFAESVTAAGARMVPYRSEFEHFDVPEAATKEDAEEQMHLVYLRENIAILRAAERALADDPPDLVTYDVFPFIAGRLLATRWQRPAVRFSPIFAANEHYSIFDTLWQGNGYRHPAELPEFRATMTDLLAEYGVRREVKEYWNDIEDFNIVFIPKSFQIAGDTFDDRFAFVGPSFTGGRLQPQWHPPGDDRPILLASLGNQFNRHPEFFRSCAHAFTDTPWHVVMAIGGALDPAELGELPPNVEVHPWVSFMDVLPHAKVCLTHGTTGAVMESLYWGRPLAIAPHYASEAIPSAQRVIDMGLGHHLTPDKITVDSLAPAIDELAGDDDVLRRVEQLSRDIRGAGGPVRAAEEIERYMARADHSPQRM